MDYEDNFSLVAKMTAICTIITVASIRQWHFSQMDVKNAFLNGVLHESLIIMEKFASLRNFYMVLNRHFELGLRSSLLLSPLLGFPLLIMIQLSLSSVPLHVVFFFPYMLMIQLLLVMMLMGLQC